MTSIDVPVLIRLGDRTVTKTRNNTKFIGNIE